MAADPTKAARAMLDTGKKHLKMTRKQISLNTLEKLLRKQLGTEDVEKMNWRDSELRRRGQAGRRRREPNSGGSNTIFNNIRRFFTVNLKVEEIFSLSLSLFVIVSSRMIFVILYLYTT